MYRITDIRFNVCAVCTLYRQLRNISVSFIEEQNKSVVIINKQICKILILAEIDREKIYCNIGSLYVQYW